MVRCEIIYFLLIKIISYQLLGGFVSQRKTGIKECSYFPPSTPQSRIAGYVIIHSIVTETTTVCYSDNNITYDDRNICVQHLRLVTTTCRGDYNSRPLAKIYTKLEMAG